MPCRRTNRHFIAQTRPTNSLSDCEFAVLLYTGLLYTGLFYDVAALHRSMKASSVGGEQYRHKKGRNVDSGTEESHVSNLSDTFIVGVQKIGRAPEIGDPDDRNGERPTPREHRNRKKRQDCGDEIAPCYLVTDRRAECGRYESNHDKVHSQKPKRMQRGEDSQCVVAGQRTKRRPYVELGHHEAGDEGAR